MVIGPTPPGTGVITEKMKSSKETIHDLRKKGDY